MTLPRSVIGLRPDSVDHTLEYWASAEKPSEPHEVDASLSSLLTSLVPLLTRVPRNKRTGKPRLRATLRAKTR